MTKFGLLLMVSILFSVLGCRNNKIYKKDNSDIYPKENFSVVEATFNGKPEIGSFNMAYKNFRDKANFPWCLNLHIELDSKNLYANGLPLPDETKIANKLEDELIFEIRSITTAHFIGHLFNDSFLDIYFYLDKPEKVHEYLQIKKDKKDLCRGIGYEIVKDSNWDIVQKFIK